MIETEKQLNQSIQELFQQTSIESAIQCFLKTLATPYLYFSWLPQQYALKLMHSYPSVNDRRVLRLYESDASFQIQHLQEPHKIKSLTQWVDKVVQQQMRYKLITVKGEPFGICCFSKENQYIDILVQCLQNKCESLIWKKQYMKFSDYDYFLKQLYTEISRARRLSLPVSLVLIECLFKNPKEAADQDLKIFFKSLHNHLYKSSRLYDFISQISSTEIACILPHTSQASAQEKAQKIQWILNSLDTNQIFNAPMTCKIAVAEYPSVARDAVGLVQLARKSCTYQDDSGICIATATPGFRPDFTAQTIPESLCELT